MINAWREDIRRGGQLRIAAKSGLKGPPWAGLLTKAIKAFNALSATHDLGVVYVAGGEVGDHHQPVEVVLAGAALEHVLQRLHDVAPPRHDLADPRHGDAQPGIPALQTIDVGGGFCVRVHGHGGEIGVLARKRHSSRLILPPTACQQPFRAIWRSCPKLRLSPRPEPSHQGRV